MSSSLKPDIVVVPSDLFAQISNTSGTVPYTTVTPELGVRAVTGDGREFRYCQAGATTLVQGTLQQGYAQQSNLQNITAVVIAATTVNSSTLPSTTVSLTVSTGTAIAANALSGGLFTTYGTASNGGGQSFLIGSNLAISASGTTLTVTLVDPILTAVTTSATVNIVPPLYQGVVQLPTTQTNAVAGLAVTALPASYYGWLQVKGLANALIQGTPSAFLGLAASTTTAGALEIQAATVKPLAINLMTGVNGQFGPVDLLIS